MTLRVDTSVNVVPPGYARGRSGLVVLLWQVVEATLFRASPRPAYGWRRFLLRLFGAQIGRGVQVRPSVRVEFPWRLSIGEHSAVGDEAWLYSLDRISIGAQCVVSQKAFLCTGSHDPDDPRLTLVTAPISLGDGAWIAADVFIGPGVEVGAETVVGARSSVFRSLPPGMICRGTPCVPVRERHLAASEGSVPPGGPL